MFLPAFGFLGWGSARFACMAEGSIVAIGLAYLLSWRDLGGAMNKVEAS